MGETPDELDTEHPYDVTFWYHANAPENMRNVAPSDGLEEAFAEVHVWHDRHKNVWDVTITEEEFLEQVDPVENAEDFEDEDNNEQELD